MKNEDDIIVCPETYNISSRQIMPFILDIPYKDIKRGVKPSVIIAALKLTTEERLEKLRSPSRKHKVCTKKDTFSRCPEAIIFQNFKRGVTYSTPLIITNQRTVPKNIQIYFESSRHFGLSMNSRKNHQTRIAPGMSITIYIHFFPTDPLRDYVREIRVVGDEDSFKVPVYGLGPRPLANMPDKIVFPPTLVKVQSTTSILIKNTGIVNMEFVNILDKPFSCDILKAIVPANGILGIKYICCSVKSGVIRGQLKAYFKNELCVATELECEVQSARIELETHLVTFEDVFMGLSKQNMLVLHNNSNYAFNFSWKMYNEEKEQEEFRKLINLMIDMKDYQIEKYEKLQFLDIVDPEKHADIYQRILEDELNELLLTQNKYLFNSSFFNIIPKVGKILPKSDFGFSVIFSPQQNICYNSWAYLDIEGTEKRVRVGLQGGGIGPPVMLCVKKLNASQIYLTDKHQYELAVKNKGVIAATVTYQPKDKTDWGGVLECIPLSLTLGPDTTKAFVIVFYSEVQGDFLETLDFIVEESKDHLQCIFIGQVVCPLLKCIPDVVDFGTVSVGLQHTKELCLVNDSQVKICYEIEINEGLKAILQIIPIYGIVSPNSRINLKIIFKYGIISTWKKEILLIMWKSRQYTRAIPFRCICSCPKITCTPQTIKIKFCFLNCHYFRTIKIENQTDLPGYVEYKPLEKSGEPIQCVPQQTKVYLNAYESVEINLNILVTALGPHQLPLYFKVVGGIQQKLCSIYCNGQGPVISYYPDEVDFGKIDVLKKSIKSLTLINDSPISAKFRVYCKNKSAFSIEESSLELAPEEALNLSITAVFNNAGKVKDILYLEISDSDVFTIKVFGEGIGCSIVFDPPLYPKLDLGAILTYKIFSHEVLVTNKSSYIHKLFFSKRSIVKSFFKDDEEDQIPWIFNIEPRYLELEADQETKLAIKCSSKKIKSSKEEYYCHGLIGKSVIPQLIMTFSITAEFVDPKLDFSKTEFNFKINVNGSETDGTTEDVLTFNNVTGVPLQVIVTVEDSFSIIEGNRKSQYLTQDLRDNSGVIKEIKYCPNIKEKRRRKQRGRIVFKYENHPKTDVINLYGEIMFPTIKLFPSIVDFHCIPLGSTSYQTVVIQNVSAMVVSFKWLWVEKSIKINDLNSSKAKTTIFKMDNVHPQKKVMEYIDIGNKPGERRNTYDLETEESQMIVTGSETDNFRYSNEKYFEEMSNVLFPILSPLQERNKEHLTHIITPKPTINHDITKWFCLEPSEGLLNPSEYTLVTIGFSPPPNMEIVATARCKILGGEEEQLVVMGKSTSLSYKLDKKSVNFGNQVFCEICTDELILTNNGPCSFDFKVIMEETVCKQAEMLDIRPKIGNVSAGSSITFQIEYFPGFPGKFEKQFTLELGYLEPVSIKVHGYAVVSQVFLHVPRLDMGLSITDSYKALAWITPEYLESVQNDNNIGIKEDEPLDPTNFMEEHGWTYVSYNDLYPSLLDINLAMERIVAFNHISKNKNILNDHTSSKNKTLHIPNFFPPPYCVDFGYVVRDIPVCYTVLIYNYGPIKTEVKLLEDNKSALLEKEFKIEFKNSVMLPGATIEMFVLFSPSRRRCKDLNTKLEDVFRLTVNHGPIISVKLKAEVTLPSVCMNGDSLYFEKVYCGDVLRRTKILKNVGNVPCKWFASMSKATRKEEATNFFVIPKEGELEPGKETYLSIYFAPTVSRKMKRTLQIDMEGNSKSIFVGLFGEGLEIILQIAPTEIKFPSTLPFFENASYFAIQNLSNVPVEVYFPTLDKASEDEKMLIQIYLKYKNLKYVFIPFRAVGDMLPDFFTITYINLVEKLRTKMIESKTAEDGGSVLQETEIPIVPQKRIEDEDPLAKYSPAELKALLMEYITAEGFENDFSTKATTYQLEESTDLIEIVELEPKTVAEPIERNGVLMVFHGAVSTDYYKAANQAGIALSFPVYSIDRLIIESLVEFTHPCAEEIIKRINERCTELTTSDLNLISAQEENEYDKILDKITIILMPKPKKPGKKTSAKEKNSKASSEKSQGKNKNVLATDCFLNIIPEHFVDLLKPKLKQFTYLIIESLNSIFLPKENLSLYTILRAAGAVQYIQLVILSHTVDDYVKTEVAKLETTSEKAQAENISLQKNITKMEISPPKTKSVRGDSEKKSKSSPQPKKNKGPVDLYKKILHGLNKNFKIELEKFEELQREILHISEHWDRRSAVLKKPYNEKLAASIKKDTSNKDSSRTLKSSVKRQTSVTNDDVSITSTEPGLHLWIILNSSSDRPIDFCEMIRSCIVTDGEFQNVLNDIPKSMEPTFEESETIFSQISKPSTRTNPSSTAFIIRNFKGGDSTDTLRSRSKSSSFETKTRRRKNSRNSRKSADSKLIVDLVSTSFPKTEREEFEFSTRLILNPEETVKYQVAFSPVKCGKYSQTYTMVDTKNKIPYKVICNAECEYPKIDFRPEVIFPKILENYRDKASYDHFVYIKDQNIFDFGSVIVGNNKETCQVYSSEIILRNPTNSSCEVLVSLSNDNFYAEPNNIVIRSKCEEKVKLCIKPTEIGTITTQVFLSVKNNPKVEEFTLACTPCRLEFSISPKSVGFEKVPVSYKAKRIIRMTNSSPINLRWEFVERDWNNGIFDLSEESGYVGLYSVSDIVFNFKPKEELLLPKKHLQIRVFDVNSTHEDPCFIDTIIIHADSVEYNLEVENLIDYGEIKGGVDSKYSFPIINKGKCEVAIMFYLINNPLEQTNFVREFFKISPQVLTVGAQKTEHISVIFHPTCNLSVENLLLCVINMVESVQSGHIVKSYKVKTSATVFMPSYKMCPHSEMTFGHVQLLSSKKMLLELTNTGRFSFSFVLQSYAKFLDSLTKGTGKKGKKEKGEKNTEEKKSKTDMGSVKTNKNDKETKNTASKISKGTQSSKIDKKKMKITKLDIDGFSMVPSSGIVDPNETFEVSVEFIPREIKKYNEEILLNISEIEDFQKKQVFTLKAFGCEPKINLRDFNNIFMEQYIVTTLDEFIQPKNIDNYCIFVSSEIALHFKLVCVNATKTIPLHFKNIGFVTANITARVDDFGKNVFSVLPVNRKLDPYSTCTMEVTFKPDSLEIVRGILEISYNASDDNKLSIQLLGQACLPQIKLLNPIPKNNETILNFGPICVGRVQKEKISFKNVGPIKCKVIVEISDSEKVFQVIPDSNTTKKFNVQIEEYTADMKEHLLLNLLPDELAEFEVVYKPVKEQWVQVPLSLHIVYNPFEINKIILNANSYNDDIVIDNLKALNLESTGSFRSSLIATNTIGYLLDFGHRELNKLSKLCFFIRNRSEKYTFRFKFDGHSVTFFPEVGHLKPFAYKEILVVFKSSEPIFKEKEEILCILSKIEYVSPDNDPLSWDDRQTFVHCVADRHFSVMSHESDVSAHIQESGTSSLQMYASFYSVKQGTDDVGIIGKYAASSTSTIGKPSEEDLVDTKVVIEEGMEPEFSTLPDLCKIIPLFLTVAADYCKYSCETQDINFVDTYIKEKNIKKLEVKNIGTVPLNINWDINAKSIGLSLRRSSSSSNISKNSNKIEPPLQSVSASSLFSREDSDLEKRPSCPVTINPAKSVIKPGQLENFNVIFSPETAESFRCSLRSRIDLLDPNYSEIYINVNGKALPVPFYFEYEDGFSTNKDLVIKFECVGNESECTRNVLLVNPHDEQISFEIVPEYQKEFSCFICEVPTGKIDNKKKALITFSFTPHTFGSFKKFYILKIPEKNVITNILLEGVCRPPKVYFTENNIILKPTVPRVKTVKSLELVNEEVFSVSFKFNKKSQFDETQNEKLEIYPIVGKLKPKSKSDIRITFITSNIATIKFHVKCMVEKLKAPLILHVSASCIEIESLVSFTDNSGNVVRLEKDAVNVIDLGHTYKGKKEILLFQISNKGQTGMFYEWKFDSKPVAHLFKVSIDTDKGFVKKSVSATTRLQLEALRLGQLKQFKVNLNIMYGPNYMIHLNVISDKPIYSFSFDEYNFGYCFIQKGATKIYSTMLSFKNLDSNPILLENLYEKTDYLTVKFMSSHVLPGSSRNIQILFHPQKIGLYQANISFLLGTFKQTIPITGEGIEVKLELFNLKDKFINFGEVLVGTVKKYKVGVINNTPARMDVHFTLFENLVILQKKTERLEKIDMKMPVLPSLQEAKKAKNDKKMDKSTDTKTDKQKTDKKSNNKEKKQKEQEKEMENQKATEVISKQQEEERKEYLKSFMIVPNMFIDIPPQGTGHFEIIFQPNKRISFEEKVYFEIQDHYEPLCILKGLGVSPEFSLDRTDLLFSGVIVNCSKTQLITLKNTGDVIGSFNWTISDKRNLFNIEPKQGFVLPNNDMKIKVTFSPTQEKCEYKVKAKCAIKEFKEPLQILLKGNSLKIPEPKETVTFTCNVREQAIQYVILPNKSSETWLIHPEIFNGNFSTPKEITALPFTDTQIAIMYAPKTMTPSKPDEGKMFIKMTSGGALVYKLIGTAGPPAVKKRLEKEVACKQNNFVTLLIENWMDVKQSFNVFTEVISPMTTKTLFKILGLKSIQLDGKQSKNYRWGVYLVNDIPIEFRVTFKNSKTGEYEYYEINLKVLPAQLIETIAFCTRVREPITKQFALDNPVDVPIMFALDCAERNLAFEKSITLEPYTTTKVDLTYNPLRAEDLSTVLNARCEELGVYSYSIKLHADTPKSENSIKLTAELGEKAIKTILFKNVFDRVVEFSYKFDNEEFYMERCNPISIGESSKILVAFDPSKLGRLNSNLFLNSLVAGEYIYPLEGEGISPTPKGPFSVRPNNSTLIEFKNPFNEEKTFIFQIQPDIFSIELNEDVIKPKKSTKILVYAQSLSNIDLSCRVTGKLTIYSANEPELEWTYYLLLNQT